MRLIFLLNLLWLPDGWEGHIPPPDDCLRIQFTGMGENCGVAFPATWKWYVDGQLEQIIEDFPHAYINVPTKYGTQISYVLIPQGFNSCPTSGVFTLTEQWFWMNNNYSPCPHCESGERPHCPERFKQIFSDGFESGGIDRWSDFEGERILFQDGFETGDISKWNF